MAKAKDADVQALAASFPFGINVAKYIDQAVRSGSSDPVAYAQALILRSPEFAARFPGIKRADGTLRMDPRQYIAQEEQYTKVAGMYGYGLTRQQFGAAVAQGVSPEEFELRSRAIQQFKSDPSTLEFLNQQIADINKNLGPGQKQIPPVQTLSDAVNFYTGKASPTVYQVYEAAELQVAAKNAGVKLSAYEARQIAGQTPGALKPEEAEQHFAQVAQNLRQAGPELQAALGRDYQSKLRTIEFGGPNRVQLALQAEQALKQAKAAKEAPVVAPRTGLQAGRPVTATQVQAGF